MVQAAVNGIWHSVDLEQTIKCFLKKSCSTAKPPQVPRVIEVTNDTRGLQLIKKNQYEIKSSFGQHFRNL